MTNLEFNDLFDLLSFGHDAEIVIGKERVFIEWQDTCISVYHIVEGKGQQLKEIKGSDKVSVVTTLFQTSILGKNLNENYNEIDVLDIE